MNAGRGHRQERRAHAVVAGIGLNGLGVIRSLARATIPVVAIDFDLSKPEAATRFGRKLRVPALSGPAFVEALLSLRSEFETNPLLILTEEASVATVSEARERLEQHYRFTLPERKTVAELMDKTAFQRLAEQNGFCVPRAITIGDTCEIGRIQAMRFPCVLKPATKDSNYALRFAKAYRVENVDDVLSLWRKMREVIASAILQEWIVGEDSDVYFCLQYRDRPDNAVASFVGRKMLQWPPLVGGTASCIPAPEAKAELLALTNRFFAAMNFSGFCSMEYKRDRRDQIYYMVEPTVGRTDYQEEIATLNGTNIPALAYWSAAGETPIAEEPPSRMEGWRDPSGEANARASGASPPSSAQTGAIRYRDAYLRFDDPAPYFKRQLGRVRTRLSRFGG